MRNPFKLSTLSAVLLIYGCATPVVTIPGVERAQIPIRGIKRIAVMDFTDFGGRPGSGRAASSALVSQLKEQGYYELVERGAIEEVLKEQAFSLMDVVKEETAAEVGRILGVNALIIGEVTAYEVEERRYKETETRKVKTGEWHYEMKKKWPWSKEKTKEKVYEYKEETVDVYYREKAGTVRVNYRMVDVETGEVIAAGTKTASYSRRVAESEGKLGSLISLLGVGAKLPGNSKILTKLLDDVTAQFVTVISPHRVFRRKFLDEGRSDYTERGVKFALEDLWDDAEVEWKKAILVNPKDAAAHNNLGVAHERAGRLEEARREYEAALKLDPDEIRYRKNLADLGAPGLLKRPEERVYIVLEMDEDGTLYVDFGDDEGAEVGDQLMVYREREVKHPLTGEVMGVDQIEIAIVSITEVFPRMSAAKVIRSFGDERVEVSCKVRRAKAEK